MTDLYNTAAFSNKNLLKQDSAYRIATSYNYAGAFINCLLNPTEIKIETVKPDNSINVMSSNPFILEAQKEKREAPVIEQSIKQIDKNVFCVFLQRFYELWISTVFNIPKDKWSTKELKEELFKLFLETEALEELNIRKVHEQYINYLRTLQISGITDVKYYTFKPEETMRESI